MLFVKRMSLLRDGKRIEIETFDKSHIVEIAQIKKLKLNYERFEPKDRSEEVNYVAFKANDNNFVFLYTGEKIQSNNLIYSVLDGKEILIEKEISNDKNDKI